MPRLLVDANIFLELELGQSRAAECREFLSGVARGKIKATTTDFILDSIGVIMEDRGSPPTDIAKFFSSLTFFKGLLIHNLGLVGRVKAAHEMENQNLSFDDSTSVAAMRSLDIKEIVSFDRDFDKVRGVARIEPGTVISRIQSG